VSIAHFYETGDWQSIMVLVLTLFFGVVLGVLTILFCCRKDDWRKIGVPAVVGAAVALAIGLLAIRFEAAIQFALAYVLVVGGGGLMACLRPKENRKGAPS
jgi:hypothetical protein